MGRKEEGREFTCGVLNLKVPQPHRHSSSGEEVLHLARRQGEQCDASTRALGVGGGPGGGRGPERLGTDTILSVDLTQWSLGKFLQVGRSGQAWPKEAAGWGVGAVRG